MSLSFLHRALGAALSCCLLAPAYAAAANGEGTPLGLDEAPARAAQAAPGGGGLVRTIVGLAVVLGVIYGLHWVLKQVKSTREERHTGLGLGTVATLPLGPNRSLHLIRAGHELVLVGAGEHGVTPIRTYSETEARTLGLLDGETDELADPQPNARLVGVARLLDGIRARTVLK